MELMMLVTLEMIQAAAAVKPAELHAILKAGDLPVGDADTINSCRFLGMMDNGVFVYEVNYGHDEEEGVCNVYAKWKRQPFSNEYKLVGVL